MKIRVSVLGATGYTGLETIRILSRHAEAEVVSLPSRREGGVSISTVHPELAGRFEMPLTGLDADEIAAGCDVAISCLPHGVSQTHCGALLARGVKVVDVSADYRLKDAREYERWYGVKHQDREGLAEAVYGLPELFGEEIRKARIVANPGCYPTASVLALAGLVKGAAVGVKGVVVDAKSGVSGAGKKLTEETHFPEANENMMPYAVGSHRHTPEISNVLSQIGGEAAEVVFVPHLAPMTRGIIATCYADAQGDVTDEELYELNRSFYENARFVRVLGPGKYPATRHVERTNVAEISARVCGDKVVAMCAIDNLVKGAAGQAVQNMNLMFGLDEGLGLDEL